MNEGEKKGRRQTDPTDWSYPSDRTDPTKSTVGHARLRPSGGYRNLRSFQVASVIYDATVSFCDRFMDKRSRTVDQMVQAARSGRQNIAEGSRASAASSQTELRLVNVARASLDELLLDFEDFLRQRGLPQWSKDDHRALAVREVGKKDRTDRSDRTDPSDAEGPYSPWLDARRPGGGRQCHNLPDPPGQLPPRPADCGAGEAIHPGGGVHRTVSGGANRGARPAAAIRAGGFDGSGRDGWPGLPKVQRADGAADGSQGGERGITILGLLRLPQV